MSSLPYPWVELKTEDGSPYFWNKETNTTSWDRPSANQYSVPQSYENYYETDYNDDEFNRRPVQVFASSSNQPGYSNNNFGPNYYNAPKPNQPLGAKPEKFQADIALKTAGSHTSISLPMGVTKMAASGGLRYEDFQNFKWDSVKANTFQGDKSGYMERLKGTTWYTQWFVLKGSLLYWFQDQLEKFPQGEIPLTGALIEDDQMVKRPFAIHIFVQSTKRHYCVVPPSAEDYSGWLTSLRRATTTGVGGSYSQSSSMGRPQNMGMASMGSGGYERSNTYNAPTNNPLYNSSGPSYGGGGGGASRIPNPGYRPQGSADNIPSYNSSGPSYGGGGGAYKSRSSDDSGVSYDPRGKEFNPPNVKPGGKVVNGSRDDSALTPRPPAGNRNGDRTNWEQHETADGYMYYWNRVTGESSWDRPY